MNNEYIGKYIATLFLSFRYFIIPVLSGLAGVIKIISTKYTIKRAGKNYYKPKEKVTKKQQGILFFLLIAIVGISGFLLLTGNRIVPMLCFGYILYSFGDLLCKKLYGNIEGIYENGILTSNMNLKTWREIHSYMISENCILGYYKNGDIFEYKEMENPTEIEELFRKNNITKREG